MARVLMGDIRWADLNPVRGHQQAGKRPVLILSQDVFNERSAGAHVRARAGRGPRRVQRVVGRPFLFPHRLCGDPFPSAQFINLEFGLRQPEPRRLPQAFDGQDVTAFVERLFHGIGHGREWVIVDPVRTK